VRNRKRPHKDQKNQRDTKKVNVGNGKAEEGIFKGNVREIISMGFGGEAWKKEREDKSNKKESLERGTRHPEEENRRSVKVGDQAPENKFWQEITEGARQET